MYNLEDTGDGSGSISFCCSEHGQYTGHGISIYLGDLCMVSQADCDKPGQDDRGVGEGTSGGTEGLVCTLLVA
jgi:hypothetical protein